MPDPEFTEVGNPDQEVEPLARGDSGEVQPIGVSGVGAKLGLIRNNLNTDLERVKIAYQIEVVGPASAKIDSQYVPEEQRHLPLGQTVRHVLHRKLVEHETAQEQARLEEQRHALSGQVSTYLTQGVPIRYGLEDLDKLKGFRRLISSRKRGDLQKKAEELEAKTTQSQAALEQVLTELKPLGKNVDDLRSQEIQLLEKFAISESLSVRDQYEQLVAEVVEEGTLFDEVRESFISRWITPELQKAVEEGAIDESRKQQFITVVKRLAEVNVSPDQFAEEKAQLEAQYQELTGYQQGVGNYGELVASSKTLVEGGEDRLIADMFARLAAGDIKKIEEDVLAMMTSGGGYVSEYNFRTLLHDQISPDRFWDQGTTSAFGKKIIASMDAPRTTSWKPNMEFWLAIKDSPTAKAVLGEMIEQIDGQIYESALQKSLSDHDGGEIDTLRYYPTPDAIKNLVLIAAAKYENYRTVHANWTLRTLARSPEWAARVDEAILKYPQLQSAREDLLSWTLSDYSPHPTLKDKAGEFAWQLLSNEPEDQRVTMLATEALPHARFAELLQIKGVLNAEEAGSVTDAIGALDRAYQSWDDATTRGQASDFYVDNHTFLTTFRTVAEKLLEPRTDDPSLQEQVQYAQSKMKLILEISREIQQKADDFSALSFISNREILEHYVSGKIADPLNREHFIRVYQQLPELRDSRNCIGEFCTQFTGSETIDIFRQVFDAYSQYPPDLKSRLLALLRPEDSGFRKRGAISTERIVQLAQQAEHIFQVREANFAFDYPMLMFNTDSGVEIFDPLTRGNVFQASGELDVRFGEDLMRTSRAGEVDFRQFVRGSAELQLDQINRIINAGEDLQLTDQNWQLLLMGYVRVQNEEVNFTKLSPAAARRLNEIFTTGEARDMVLNKFRESWLNYLNQGEANKLPFSMTLLTTFIRSCDGAGPLSQLESLSFLISSYNSVVNSPLTTENTKGEVFAGMRVMEERFNRERWSNEARSNFYNTSRDILSAAPSLFSEYLEFFSTLTPAQLAKFSTEIYPLHRAKITMLEKTQNGRQSHDPRELVVVRRDLQQLKDMVGQDPDAFDREKSKIVEDLKELFTKRFGIVKIPENFGPDQIRALTNVSLYLSNLNDKTSQNEAVLGFYLSMMLNGTWGSFRNTEAISGTDYVTPERAAVIDQKLQERAAASPLTAERLGITPEQLPEFMSLLQSESQNYRIGSIETVDVKLTNIILNLERLEDPDLYPDLPDRQRMKLLMDYDSRRVGSVVARMYQSLTNPARQVNFSSDDEKIKAQIVKIIEDNGGQLDPQTLKQQFQDGIRPLSAVANLVTYIDETEARVQIDSLRSMLKPTEDIVSIFQRLGEDFTPTSGALALTQDLNYLDTLVVKREDELSAAESSLLKNYTDQIRGQVVLLEGIYKKIQDKFQSVRQSSAHQSNPLLVERLSEINRIVTSQSSEQPFTSVMTTDLNSIIENIRECLSCVRQGANNDTNLSFGDPNKFFLYTHAEERDRGSFADQIVYLDPIIRQDGTESLSFIFDTLYGANSPVVLENHINTVLKKVRVLKSRFPELKLSVFVPDVAMRSGGISADLLGIRLTESGVSSRSEVVEADVIGSVFSDHYVEFGGGARTAGKRSVPGILVT